MAFIHFTSSSKMVIEVDSNMSQVLKVVDIALEMSKNVDRSKYIQRGTIPNELGIKVMINGFMQGLVTAILNADKEGKGKKQDLVDYAIKQFNRAMEHHNQGHARTGEGIWDP